MTENTSYQISQGYDVLPPKPGKAYPILCEEWDFLKHKINSISYTINVYLECGVLLLGITLSTFVAIITGAIRSIPSQSASQYSANVIVIAWAVVIVTLICGVLCVAFAFEKEKIKKLHASDIISQMEIIEKRYPQTDSE